MYNLKILICERKKQIICFLLILSSSLYSKGDILRVPIHEIPKIDIKYGEEISLNLILNNIALSLVSLDESLAPVPSLAKKWSVSSSGKKIKFYLDDVLFHDASPITSKEILKIFLDRKNIRANNLKKLINKFEECDLNTCDGFKIVDDKVFEIILSGNNPEYFFKVLAGIEGSIFKKSKGKIIGSGPYQIKKITSNKVVLEKFDSLAKFNSIVFQKNDSSRSVNNFLRGDLDLFFTRGNGLKNSLQLSEYQASNKVSGTLSLVFNLRSGIFSHLENRKAFVRLIHKEKLRDVLNKYASVAGGMIPPGYIGHIPYRERKENSLKLKEGNKISGFTEIRIGLKNQYQNNKELIQFFTIVGNEIGVKIKFKFYPFLVMLDRFIKSEVDVILKSDTPIHYVPSNSFISYIKHFNRVSGYQDNELDELYTVLKNRKSKKERIKLLKRMEEIIERDIPVFPLMYTNLLTFYSRKVDTKNIAKKTLKYWDWSLYQLAPLK